MGKAVEQWEGKFAFRLRDGVTYIVDSGPETSESDVHQMLAQATGTTGFLTVEVAEGTDSGKSGTVIINVSQILSVEGW